MWLSSLQDLLGSMDQGETKTAVVAQKVELVRGSLDPKRQKVLEEKQKMTETQWEDYVDSLNTAKWVQTITICQSYHSPTDL